MKNVLLLSICVLSFAVAAFSQTVATTAVVPADRPKTKLEAFESGTGAVIVHGYTDVGKLTGAYGGFITAQSIELTDESNGRRAFGISITLNGNEHYIDYNEIDPLLRGIDFMARADANATHLANFRADHKTVSGLVFRLVTYPNTGTLFEIRDENGPVQFKKAGIADVRKLILDAKENLTSSGAVLN